MGEVKQESDSLTCNSFNVLRRIPYTDPGLMQYRYRFPRRIAALTYRATVHVPPLQELQAGRCDVWIDTLQVSIGRERAHRQDITLWRRDDADDVRIEKVPENTKLRAGTNCLGGPVPEPVDAPDPP